MLRAFPCRFLLVVTSQEYRCKDFAAVLRRVDNQSMRLCRPRRSRKVWMTLLTPLGVAAGGGASR